MQQLREIIRPFNVRIDPLIAFMIMAAIFMVAAAVSASAADKGKAPVAASDIPYMPPAAKGWSGCGVGGFVGYAIASVDSPAPITMAGSGRTTRIEVNCDAQFGVLVVGAHVNYGWVWGDLHTVGVDTSLEAGARAGVLVSQSALPYVHAGWTQAKGSGIPDVDGLQFGGGIEVKISNAPFYIDLRYTHTIYDNVGGSGMDVNADEVRLGMKYKFSVGK